MVALDKDAIRSLTAAVAYLDAEIAAKMRAMLRLERERNHLLTARTCAAGLLNRVVAIPATD